jgi:hypothetical protein
MAKAAEAKRGTVDPTIPVQDEDHHQDVVNWELTNEDGLPE